MRVALIIALAFAPAFAAAEPAGSFAVQTRRLGDADRSASQAAIEQLGASAHPRARTVLEALDAGALRIAPDGGAVIVADAGIVDAVSGQRLALDAGETARVVVTNAMRRSLRGALARSQLASPEPRARRAAAAALRDNMSDELAPLVREALVRETDGETAALLSRALAQVDLAAADRARALAAVAVARDSADPALQAPLEAMAARTAPGAAHPDAGLHAAARDALDSLERRQRFTRVGRDVVYGLSQGSLLLLAALGLAITFGVMGVINMAHGEMLMLGAYTTYAVQSLFAQHAPGVFDWYLVAALPAAFAVCFGVGVAIERLVIRYLYGRPLETLLATWGVSLLLIQTVRSLFGAQNVTVANPSWLSGGWHMLPGVVVPYARLASMAFAAVIVALVWWVLRRTQLGLQVRAVTQNRQMARGLGIATGRVDMLTFGFGSAVAGLGGVALSQIGNVGPETGQGYIVDSFMVVVVGGVGELAGAVVAALGLGVVTKLLEPLSGAVLGKILVLGFIILFIQKRPQGLFALRGRAGEA